MFTNSIVEKHQQQDVQHVDQDIRWFLRDFSPQFHLWVEKQYGRCISHANKVGIINIYGHKIWPCSVCFKQTWTNLITPKTLIYQNISHTLVLHHVSMFKDIQCLWSRRQCGCLCELWNSTNHTRTFTYMLLSKVSHKYMVSTSINLVSNLLSTTRLRRYLHIIESITRKYVSS